MISIGDSKIIRFIDENKDLKKIHNSNIEKLKSIDDGVLNVKEIRFKNKIINHFESNDLNFFTAKPIDVLQIKKSPTAKIRNMILNALDYTSHRKNLIPKFFESLGIKVCVYCNSQLAISFKKENNSYKALLEADHNYPKKYYPYLAISLYNLYPSCANCNRHKSTKPVLFDLYSNHSNKSIISFKFDNDCIVDFRTSFDISKIKYEVLGDEEYIKSLHIEEIYSTQKDVAEELIIKSLTYNETYIKELKVFGIKQENITRYIVGNYTEDSDMHKRPLSKFMADIARDLKLIK